MDFIEAIKKRVRADWDLMIVITGEVGAGKSTLGQILGFRLDDKFDQTKNIVYIPTTESMISTFNGIDRYSVFMLDEALELFYKMDFMKDYQKTLIKLYARERKQNKISILCLPSFTDLTKQLRDKRVKIWIHIIERGYGLIFTKSPSIFSEDVWYIRDSEKMFRDHFRGRKSADIDAKDIQHFAEGLPTFWMSFRFDPLPADKQKIYMDCVTQERDKYYAENQIVSRDTDKRVYAISKMYFGYKLTINQISDILLIDERTVARDLQVVRDRGGIESYKPISSGSNAVQHKSKLLQIIDRDINIPTTT